MRPYKKEGKKLRVHYILARIKEGKSPAKISKELNISIKTMQYYLRQLKKSGRIEKIGYGNWRVLKELSKTPKGTPKNSQKQIRGHAFIWKVKFRYKIDWERRLDKNKIKYQLIGVNKTTPRIIFNNRKIWLTKTGLVIYEPYSFYSTSSIASKGMAVYELDKTIKSLGMVLKIDLSPYMFTTSREHYGLIKNELARQYNDKKEKLYIRDENGTAWMWIDDSHSLNELENNEPIVNRKVQNWYNDMKKTNFEVTPSFLLNSINSVTQNQMMFNRNFESHVGAIKELSEGVKKMSEEIIRLNKIISSLKD